MRSVLLLLLALIFSVSADTAWAGKRVALVIGISEYKQVPRLTNPSRDADAVATLFRKAGFDSVEDKRDLGIGDLRRAIREFAATSQDADVAVVYYAGHGMEVDGVNYLVPADAKLASDFDIEDETISLERVLRALDGAKRLKLVILDACRDNPFATTMKRSVASRAIGRGLAKVEPTMSDTLIAFAAKAGAVASDGDGQNSPFATALVRNIAEPGLDLRIAFGRVRDDVLKSTGNRQEPFVYGSLGGDTVALVPRAADPEAEARVDYELAAQVGTKEAWDSFLAKHPTGFFANLARGQTGKLEAAQQSRAKADDAKRQAEELAAQKAADFRRQLEEQSARQTAEAKQKLSEQSKRELEEVRQQIAEQAKKELDQARQQLEQARQQADAAKLEVDQARRQAMADAQAQVEQAKRDAQKQAEEQARQQAAKEQAAKEQAARDQAAKDQAAKDQAAKDQSKQQVAALTPTQPPPPAPPPPVVPQMEQSDIARLLQAHLKRVGCNPGNGDGNWDDSSRKALELFNQNANTHFDVKLASLDALDSVRGKTDRVCPLVCGKGQRADGDHCVQISCSSGYVLNSSGACEKKPEPAPKPKTVSRQEPREPVAPRASPAPRGGGGKCFSFGGKTYCE